MLQYQLVQPTMQSSCFFSSNYAKHGIFPLSDIFQDILRAFQKSHQTPVLSRSGEIQLFCDFSALDFDFC